MIRHMSGYHEEVRREVIARLAMRVQSEGGREVLLPVGLLRAKEGLSAYPVEKGSGAVTSLLDADGYIEIREDTSILEEGSEVNVRLFSERIDFPDLLIIGSHCLGIDVISEMMGEKGFNVRSINVGSMGGFRAIRKGIADVAGVHLLDESGEYNAPFMKSLKIEDATLVKGYIRDQGIMVEKGNPLKIRGVQDLAGKYIINRTKGSGTRTLLDMELKRIANEKGIMFEELIESIHGYDIEAKTHNAVASAILTGKADAGIGIKSVADQNGLDFIPLRNEEYDLVVRSSSMEKPAIKEFLSILRSGRFKKEIERLGYRALF
jgi:putative molybdopterin biosynthesis protein